jgi:hypothetical protein
MSKRTGDSHRHFFNRFRFLFRCCLAVCGLAVAGSFQLWAGANLTKLTTPDMEVYTTDSGMAATKVLQALEQSEWFFKTASGFEFTAERPLKVLALKSVEEYAPFRLNRSAFAHYIRAQKRDYIVLQDIRPEHLHAAIHEYTHYVMKSLGFSLPIWLNEGLADFYSSILIQGQDVIVGGILPERLMTLDRQSPLDLKTLVAADQGSPILNDPATVRVFYAESWALTICWFRVIITRRDSEAFLTT